MSDELRAGRELRELELRIIDTASALVQSGYDPKFRTFLEELLHEYKEAAQQWVKTALKGAAK